MQLFIYPSVSGSTAEQQIEIWSFDGIHALLIWLSTK